MTDARSSSARSSFSRRRASVPSASDAEVR